jgi:hypothetical protein
MSDTGSEGVERGKFAVGDRVRHKGLTLVVDEAYQVETVWWYGCRPEGVPDAEPLMYPEHVLRPIPT